MAALSSIVLQVAWFRQIKGLNAAHDLFINLRDTSRSSGYQGLMDQ